MNYKRLTKAQLIVRLEGRKTVIDKYASANANLSASNDDYKDKVEMANHEAERLRLGMEAITHGIRTVRALKFPVIGERYNQASGAYEPIIANQDQEPNQDWLNFIRHIEKIIEDA